MIGVNQNFVQLHNVYCIIYLNNHPKNDIPHIVRPATVHVNGCVNGKRDITTVIHKIQLINEKIYRNHIFIILLICV